MALNIYKRGQGKYTRLATLGGGILIALVLAQFIYASLSGGELSPYIVYGVPVVIFAGISALVAWLVNKADVADFMIATESEMKKVSWSSRKEIVGGTKVVIATTFIMAVMLWAVDLMFGFAFRAMDVLQFGGGPR